MTTHETPYTLPVHVHRDRREPARGQEHPDDEQGAPDAGREDEAVGEERRAVGEHVPREVVERDDVQRVGAVRVHQVGKDGRG